MCWAALFSWPSGLGSTTFFLTTAQSECGVYRGGPSLLSKFVGDRLSALIDMTLSELFATWLTAIGTISVAIVALFQENLHRWRFRPKLTISCMGRPPDCLKIPYVMRIEFRGAMGDDPGFEYRTTAYYFRILIHNEGEESARNVEVYARDLWFKNCGRLERVKDFPPMNLVWSNSESGHKIYLPFLPPGVSKHCDVAHMIDPKDRGTFGEDNREGLDRSKTSMSFDLVTKPLHRGYIVPPGKYFLNIVVGAENCAAATILTELAFDGAWNDDEASMLRDHVTFRVKQGCSL